jgi:hypothetical protein
MGISSMNEKGLSFTLLVIVIAFIILLVVLVVFFTVGKEYLYKIVDKIFELLGRK